ncbi:MAG: diguanylate cyclase [Raoultibacter sp.]
MLLEALDHNTAVGVKLCAYAEGCRILYVNDGVTALTGYTRSELIGSDYLCVMHPEDHAYLHQQIDAQNAAQGNFQVTYQLIKKDGSRIWVLDSGALVTQEDGTVVIQSVTLDISEQKNTEEALRVSQKRNELALSFSDVTVFEYNIKTKTIRTHESDFDTYHMPNIIEDGIESVIDSGIIAPRSKNNLRKLYQEIDEGAVSASTTIYALDINGSERTLELQMVSIPGNDGKPAYAIGVRKDVTETRLFNQEKEYSSQLLSERMFIYEANVTQDKVLYHNSSWAQDAEISPQGTFSELVHLICESRIAPEDRALFSARQSQAFLLEAFHNGERLVTFEYRRWVRNKGYLWFEVKINIVQDEITNDINIRVYTLNIDERKKNELQAAAERKHYELTLSKTTMIYELNITQDTMALGHDQLRSALGIASEKNHIESTLPEILKQIHPHDRAAMSAFLSYANLKQAFALGMNNLEHEYRRLDAKDTYRWFHCALQLFEDVQTHDLMCYAYIEDIDTEKREELTLLYNAQHDLMTGFYNKATTEEKINAILESTECDTETHVFLIVDLDYFKEVNDQFGHAFGDAVISQAAEKIKELFRMGDVLGRIGGDEFAVFMKNVSSEQIAFLKAQEICDALTETYTQGAVERTLTTSVGIALYNKHGTTYDELYRNSDTALYDAKQKGRGQFSLYDATMQISTAAPSRIDSQHLGRAHTLESHISEYVFRILFESQDKQRAIKSVLELIGKHYHISRAYVVENSNDGAHAHCTFEWHNEDIAPLQLENLGLTYADLGDYSANFGQEGMFLLTASAAAKTPLEKIFRAQNVITTLQFSIMRKGHFAGFIGFDECVQQRDPGAEELNDYRNFANILSVFITEMRALEQLQATSDVAFSLINNLDSYAYVCNPRTHKLLFVNDKTRANIPSARVGDVCHKALWGNDKPCPNCPMQNLEKNGGPLYTTMRYSPKAGVRFKVTTSWIDWLDNEKACLINSADLSEA